METRYLITKQGKNWRIEREGNEQFLKITNLKTGEPHSSPKGLIIDNGGIEKLWAKCQTQEQYEAMGAYLRSPEHKAKLAQEIADRKQRNADFERRMQEKREKEETEYQEKIKGQIVEPTAHNIYIILRHFNNQNWGAWDLSEVKLQGCGFSMAQYDCEGKQATTIKLTKKIEFNDEQTNMLKIGGKRGHLTKYTEIYDLD